MPPPKKKALGVIQVRDNCGLSWSSESGDLETDEHKRYLVEDLTGMS